MNDWDKRTKTGIFGILVANACLSCENYSKNKESQEDFYRYLTEDMIDNLYGEISRGTRRSQTCTLVGGSFLIAEEINPKDCICTHCMPMKTKLIARENCMVSCVTEYNIGKKLSINSVHVIFQLIQFDLLKQARISSSNMLMKIIDKFLK